jgi:hypothetical protein
MIKAIIDVLRENLRKAEKAGLSDAILSWIMILEMLERRYFSD